MESPKRVQQSTVEESPLTPTPPSLQEPAPFFETPKTNKSSLNTSEGGKPKMRRQLSFYYPVYELKEKPEASTSPVTPPNEVPEPAPKGAPKSKSTDRMEKVFTGIYARHGDLPGSMPSYIRYPNDFGGTKRLVYEEEVEDEVD